MPTRILIADKLAPEGADFLRSQPGVEVTVQPGLTGSELAGALAAHHGVVVRSAVRITGDILDESMGRGGSELRAIARAGVGVDNIDLEAATRYGVVVMNSASASTITTAEHAFALMIGLARNIGHAHAVMAAGGWDRSKYTGTQLHGKSLGVVGFGRIGQTLAQRGLAFGMKVLAYDPFINAESALDGQVKLFRSFDGLIEHVDVVSFHVPKTESTTGMLGREQFARAREGLLVVNAARGGVVDEEALLEALASGRCGGAALDVFTTEPPPQDSALRNHPKILTTPHLGASTVEAQEAVAVDACKALLNYLGGQPVDGAVNIGSLRLDLTDRQRDFVDLAARMVALLQGAGPGADPGAAPGAAPGAGPGRLSGVRFTIRGESLAGRADTIARFALADLLRAHLDQPVNVVNAALIAEQRHLETETLIASDQGEDRLAIELIPRATPPAAHRVEGAIFADGLPRVLHLDGYAMDMVPAGHMVLLTNTDEPGRIGLVGQLFGSAGVNIAEMVIGRKPVPAGDGSGASGARRQDSAGARRQNAGGRGPTKQVAMMILKVDQQPTPSLLEQLRRAPGILRVALVDLPPAAPIEAAAQRRAKQPAAV